MKFEVTPILDTMEAFYQLPRDRQRFQKYLSMLQGGTKGDLVLPIGAYNPMAKENVLLKIRELKDLGAEDQAREELKKINASLKGKEKREIAVVINLADDVGGQWTDRFVSDHASRFDLNALVSRNFCTPHVWTGEEFSTELLSRRIRSAAYRTIHWMEKGKPRTLKDHFEQELYVRRNSGMEIHGPKGKDMTGIGEFLTENSLSEEYALIFNFFYGDEASEMLGYRTYGLKGVTGLDYIESVL